MLKTAYIQWRHVYEIPDYDVMVPQEVDWRNFIVHLAFPWRNIGSKLSMLFSTVVGNISMAPRLKLLDLRFTGNSSKVSRIRSSV